MAFNTSAKTRDTSTDAGPNVGENSAKNRDSNGKRKSIFDKFDKNHDGHLGIDDVLIGIREILQWCASHRFGMFCYMGVTVLGAVINIKAWSVPLATLGPLSPIAALAIWGTFQYMELDAILDTLNLKSSLAALIRLQRKPLEIPLINENLHSNASKKQKEYLDRESKQDLWTNIRRFLAYICEAVILILGGGLIGSMGIHYGPIMLAIVGMVGVEVGLRGFCSSAEKLLDQDERDYMSSILEGNSRKTVTTN